MSRNLRAGVIGVGTFGSLHARVYAELASADLVAVADIQQEKTQRLVSQYGVTGYDDYNELLEKEDLDIVSVCTSDELHLAPVLAAAAAGKHIFVEKPLAMNPSDCDTMIQAAEDAGVKFTVGQILRFDPRYYAARKAITDGEIGAPVHLFARRNNPIGNAMRLGKHTSVLFFLGIHDIDFMNWCVGSKVERVYAETRNFEPTRYLDTQNLQRPVPSDVEDTAICVLTFKNGLIGRFVWTHAAIGKEIHQRIYYGSEGSIDDNGIQFKDGSTRGMDELREEFLNALTPDAKEKLFPHGITNAVALGIYDFLDAVRNNREPEVTGWDGFAAQAVCDAIYESAHCRQAVNVDDVISGKIEAFQADINEHWGL